MPTTTDYNESLTCIALAYFAVSPNPSLEDFENFLLEENDTATWRSIKGYVDIDFPDLRIYRARYRQTAHKKWIKGAYYSAERIIQYLKINPSNYYYWKIGKGTTKKYGYTLKEIAISSIKSNYRNSGGNSNIMLNLSPDKFAINDIWIISQKSNIFKEITSLAKKNKLTIFKYKDIIQSGFVSGEIFPISLKQVIGKNVPISTLNAPVRKDYTDVTDEFYAELLSLINEVKKSGISKLPEKLDNFITIEGDPIYDKTKRLLIYYNFNYKSKVKQYEVNGNFAFNVSKDSFMRILYFRPKTGSNSPSGEGGITPERILEIMEETNSSQLKRYFTFIKDYRMKTFKEIYENHPENDGEKLNLKKELDYGNTFLKPTFLKAKDFMEIYELLIEMFDKKIAYNIIKDYYTSFSGGLVGRAGSTTTSIEDIITNLSKVEFGYFFDNNQKIISNIIKKEILLSLYAAASGRGYIYIDGKRITENKLYNEEVGQPIPIVKVGI